MLEINPGLTIWTIVIFLTLLAILKKYAFRPISDLVQKQEDTIRGAIERATKLNMEAETRKKEAEKLIDDAKKEARKILEQATINAEKMKEEIIQEARKEANLIIENTKKEVAIQREKFYTEMERIVVEISGTIAREILKREITSRDNRHLIQKALRKVENLMS